MRKLVILFLAMAYLLGSGCAKRVNKYWESAGGSRADATIVIGYTYNPGFEIPQTSSEQAHDEALKRCRAWGYQEAEPFGLISQYPQPNGLIMVTQRFQCLGRGDSNLPGENNKDFVGPIKPKK